MAPATGTAVRRYGEVAKDAGNPVHPQHWHVNPKHSHSMQHLWEISQNSRISLTRRVAKTLHKRFNCTPRSVGILHCHDEKTNITDGQRCSPAPQKQEREASSFKSARKNHQTLMSNLEACPRPVAPQATSSKLVSAGM